MTKREKLAYAIMEDAGVRHWERPKPGKRHANAIRYAMSSPSDRVVWGPHPKDDVAIATLAHEAGHVAVSPTGVRLTAEQITEEEFKATRWGIEAIRRHGTVTDTMQADMRAALWTYVSGSRVIPSSPEIVAFLNGANL